MGELLHDNRLPFIHPHYRYRAVVHAGAYQVPPALPVTTVGHNDKLSVTTTSRRSQQLVRHKKRPISYNGHLIWVSRRPLLARPPHPPPNPHTQNQTLTQHRCEPDDTTQQRRDSELRHTSLLDKIEGHEEPRLPPRLVDGSQHTFYKKKHTHYV